MLIVAPLSAYSLFSIMYAVWVPHERLVIAGTNSPAVGYVLEDNGPWFSILESGSRRIHRYQEPQVLERQICTGHGYTGQPFPQATVWHLLSARGVFGRAATPATDC
jgi:hypothetical protein